MELDNRWRDTEEEKRMRGEDNKSLPFIGLGLLHLPPDAVKLSQGNCTAR